MATKTPTKAKRMKVAKRGTSPIGESRDLVTLYQLDYRGWDQVTLALNALSDLGGSAHMSDIRSHIESRLDGHKLSTQGRASLAYNMIRYGVHRGLLEPYDRDRKCWTMTTKGRETVVASRHLEGGAKTGAEAGLTGDQQIAIVLEYLAANGGKAEITELRAAVEAHMGGSRLSYAGRQSLSTLVSREAVAAKFIRPYEQTKPYWEITQLGRAETGDPGPISVAAMVGEIERVWREVAQRQGQGAFRDELLEVYGRRCAISGCDVEETLEAAHIVPFCVGGVRTHHVSNGLVLRADLHTLFDQGLITIDDGYRVLISPALASSQYASLAGTGIGLSANKSFHPNREALAYHRKLVAPWSRELR